MRKSFFIALTLLLSTILIATLTLNASATRVPIDFGTWKGSGTISANVGFDSSALIKLSCESESSQNEEVDPTNYIVTGTDETTIITLKEEYLETLEEGEYNYIAEFSKENLGFTIYELRMLTQTEAVVPVDSTGLRYSVAKIIYLDDEVDPSNYTITKTTSSGEESINGVITFSEEYIGTLSGDHSFQVLLSYDSDVRLIRLTVYALLSPSPTPTSQTTIPTPTVPQTGDISDTLAWTIVLIVSTLGVCAALMWRKQRKTHGRGSGKHLKT